MGDALRLLEEMFEKQRHLNLLPVYNKGQLQYNTVHR